MTADQQPLPPGWEMATLGELGMVRTRTIDPSTKPLEKWQVWSVPSFPSGNPEVLTGAEIGSTKQLVEPGDVLLCKINPRINRVWLVEKRGILDQIASSEWIVLRSRLMDARFLMHRMREPVFRERLLEDVSGVGGSLMRARPEAVGKISIEIPPLPEQHRIVSKIEALQERSGRAAKALAEVGPLLEQFRQSILAAAFSGRLTADWRAKREAERIRREGEAPAEPNAAEPGSAGASPSQYETAHQLLTRIRTERRHRWEQAELTKYQAKGKQPPKDWKNKYEEPEPVDETDLPELPEGWCWCRLGMLGADPLNAVQTGPFGAQLHTDEFVEAGVPVIAVGNLTGVGFTKKNLYFITGKKAQQLDRYDVQAGDLLFARSGATLGKVCVAPGFVNDWRMTGHILRARLNLEYVLPEIAVYALWGDATVKKIVTEGIRGMTRPGYNTSLLNAIPLPLPPIAEQRQMLAVIEEAFEAVDNLLALRAESESSLTHLNQSILAKAFRGELVPQDPGDEPASELLARIRSQRDDSGKNTQGTKDKSRMGIPARRPKKQPTKNSK